MLLRKIPQVYGGSAGIGGRGGSGGAGGAGGAGGSSYHWTETEYRTGYRDGGSYTYTVSVSHSNPGGSSGPSGSRGSA